MGKFKSRSRNKKEDLEEYTKNPSQDTKDDVCKTRGGEPWIFRRINNVCIILLVPYTYVAAKVFMALGALGALNAAG